MDFFLAYRSQFKDKIGLLEVAVLLSLQQIADKGNGLENDMTNVVEVVRVNVQLHLLQLNLENLEQVVDDVLNENLETENIV